jgi:hypothetical protein
VKGHISMEEWASARLQAVGYGASEWYWCYLQDYKQS